MRTFTSLMALGVGLGCVEKAPLDQQVVVDIADDSVTVGEFERFVASSVHKDEPFLAGDVMEALLEQFIAEQLLLKAAADANVRAEPNEVQERLDSVSGSEPKRSPELETLVTNQIRIEALVESEVFDGLSVSEEEIATHYEENRAFFERPEAVRVSQIVVEDEELAQSIASELGGRATRFEELAKEYSTGPETGRGGLLGIFARGELPLSLEATIFALPPGRVSDVVATEFGFHIFLAHEKVPAATLPLDEVRDSIRVTLLREKSDYALALYVEELKNTYPVTVHRELLSFAFLEWEDNNTAGANLEESP